MLVGTRTSRPRLLSDSDPDLDPSPTLFRTPVGDFAITYLLVSSPTIHHCGLAGLATEQAAVSIDRGNPRRRYNLFDDCLHLGVPTAISVPFRDIILGSKPCPCQHRRVTENFGFLAPSKQHSIPTIQPPTNPLCVYPSDRRTPATTQHRQTVVPHSSFSHRLLRRGHQPTASWGYTRHHGRKNRPEEEI